MTSLRLLPIAAGPAAARALPVLREAVEGDVAVLPYAAGGRPVPVPDGAVPDRGTAVVVGTSGSTGSPKLAMLPATALVASAMATHARLGGPGSWLLAMPPHHIAGVQVLLRCVAAGTEPGFVDLSDGFTAQAFTAAADSFGGGRRYTALVPTQLLRVLDDPEASRALAGFEAVLVGGAPTSPALLLRARESGATVVTTYGMSETCGGCLYDGMPLSSSAIRVDDEGRIHLGGAILTSGYLGRPDLTAAALVTDGDGVRWFRTDDLGHRDPETGRWHVDGRIDDLISTGALKVSPRIVEEVLTSLPDIAEAVVLGLEDHEWGQVVAAAVVIRPGVPHPSVLQVRDALRGRLADHALPRRLLVLEHLPLRGPGKPDRVGIAALFHARP
ncbi:MAG: o-succinylbenzoate--CoA ligase [Pedococcus sp.]